MMQAMKGATMALGSMNRTMNLPSLQRIAMEFERENDIMEQRQEMMDDAIDDAMDVGVEEEGDEVVEQVLEEIGVDLTQAVRYPSSQAFAFVCWIYCSEETLTLMNIARRHTTRLAVRDGARRQDCSGCRWRRRRWRRRWWKRRRRRSSSPSGQPAPVVWRRGLV